MARITQSRIRAVLGEAPKPARVWQRQFDRSDDVLRQIAAADWIVIPEPALREYMLDLTYQELQPDLFRHAFPACLAFWYASLMRNESAEIGDGEFHHALLHGRILERMLTDDERARCIAIFRDGLLDRLDAERGFRYERPGKSANAWIARFNSIGLIAPIVADLWREWWAMASPGHAVSAVMYASGLIYPQGDNPIYHAWTREDGGGGPYLTEWDAAEFEHCWLDANLDFLRSTLDAGYVVERVAHAAAVLEEEPEHEVARRIAHDARSRPDTIAARIERVICNLGRIESEKDMPL